MSRHNKRRILWRELVQRFNPSTTYKYVKRSSDIALGYDLSVGDARPQVTYIHSEVDWLFPPPIGFRIKKVQIHSYVYLTSDYVNAEEA